MTLVDPQRPLSHSISDCASRAEDRRLLRRAAAAAILVHFGLLFVPLPATSPPPPSEQRESPVFITKTRFDPPPIERPSHETVRHTERRRPIPVPAVPDRILEPSVEPVETRAPEAPFDPAFILDPAPAAPASLDPLGQDTPGLVLPVAVPGRARPEYPRAGRQARLEGTVVLKAVIDRDGDVVSIRVESRPTADVGFADAAVAAVRQWRYTPGNYGGEPVAVEITVVVQFVLE